MNLRIQAAVARHESLTLKVNKGERHRITKRGLRGSLWITPLVGRFKLLPSGDVGPELHASVAARHGPKAGQDQGRSYWYIDRVDDVEALIQTLGKRGRM